MYSLFNHPNLYFLSFLLFSQLSYSNESSNGLYEPPQSLSTHKLSYPKKELSLGREGSVIVSYVVNTDGSVTDAVIVDSEGGVGFEKHALKYIRKAKFIPAKLNGVSIKSSNQKHKLTWALNSGRRGVSKKFLAKYRTLQIQLSNNQLEEYAKTISGFEEKLVKNTEERAWFSLLQANYYRLVGDKDSYLTYLNRTLSYESPQIPKKMHSSAIASLYSEQVKQRKYVEAFETAERISSKYNKHPMLDEILKHKAKVVASLEKTQVITTSGKISTSERPWHHSLYRRHIGVEVTEGKLNKMDIRCDRKATTIEITSQAQSWKIPKSWGHCVVQLWGDRDSRFRLLEQIEL
ncbi:energy transducer TonB [uncultured Pseudoteredinibacter sp.]|uniref:energy transducer TonB n=1 Tax=uncultured Pseudoteredinibacter sp. TaxID=1641701 RepID=UPI00260884F1|nr:energy transducer TonB [uncultured Pseudoteredinibacter sp.]